MKLSKSSLSYNVNSLFFALILSYIPWGLIRSSRYIDRENYSYYINFVINRIYWIDYSSLKRKISDEWGWHKILDFLSSSLNLSSNTIFFLISFLFILLSTQILKVKKNQLKWVFLISPIYVDFFYSQLRLCLAISLIYISLLCFNKSKILSFLIIIPTVFIHTSSFLFIFIIFGGFFLTKLYFFGINFKLFISILIGLIASMLTGPYLSEILGSVEDRRADYRDMSSPILYMSFWLILFSYYIFKILMIKTKKFDNYYFYISLSILTMILMNTFISGYASRFLAATFPILILNLLSYNYKYDKLMLFAYSIYTLILWLFWLT